jgi:MATE family, multidrug efflux pump
VIHKLKSLRREFRPMLRLAIPLALAELGWMSMGIVDTMMVGRLPYSAVAIGAVSIGSIIFYAFAIFGNGLLLGLDTIVSHAFGAGDVEDCHHSLVHGVYLSFATAPLLMGCVWGLIPLLQRFGIEPNVLREAIPYLKAINWSTLPLLLYIAFRRYLQAMNLVKPVTFALISANLINLAGNWILIYGHLGFRAMGVVGSGWATCSARAYMAAMLLGYILYHDRRHKTGLMQARLQPSPPRFRRLIGLGLPAAMQLTLEVGVFAAATALIGRLDAVSLAAHQIALNTASLTYMVPLGISSAAAVRVGHALGRRDARGASHAGWTALLLGAGFMSCAALAFLLFPRAIVRMYTPNIAVIRTGVSLLAVAAFFQLFDGVQVVATGALRGAGDTRTPMISSLVAYWILGLPLGAYLCFRRGWGASGIWAGLCISLILTGIFLLWMWRRRVHRLAEQLSQAAA